MVFLLFCLVCCCGVCKHMCNIVLVVCGVLPVLCMCFCDRRCLCVFAMIFSLRIDLCVLLCVW